MDWSPPGFSVHGILHARILEWVAISFSNHSECSPPPKIQLPSITTQLTSFLCCALHSVPSPLVTTTVLLVPTCLVCSFILLIFYIPHINKIIQNLSLSTWLNIISSKSIHGLTKGKISSFFKWLSSSPFINIRELDHEEGWAPNNWCFQTVVLEKTLERPLDCKEIKPVHPKGNQPWIFIERTDAKTEAPIFWPPDLKSQLIGKDSDAGKEWRQKEKRVVGDEVVR